MLTALIAVCAALLAAQYILARFKPNRRLPPGPPKWPIAGNALQMPRTLPWCTFSEWAERYGPVVHLEVFGQSYIVLSSAEAAKDLLAKRSTIFSERPHIPMVSLSGYDPGFVMKPYGDDWLKDRRLATQQLNNTALQRYLPLQLKESRIFALGLLKDHTRPERDLHLVTGRIVFDVIYGYHVESQDDPMLAAIVKTMHNFSIAADVGAWFVNIVPQLKLVPSWFPGAGFQQTAKAYRQASNGSTWKFFHWAKEAIQSGAPLSPNFFEKVISESGGNMSEEDNFRLAWCAGTLIGGGLDTQYASLRWFILAMVLHPEVQKKAQVELDFVVGTDRLPTHADKADLPYIRSVITEVHRWYQAGPLGIPHASSQDDEYNGMHIPKGSFILVNIWHMLHDPALFPHPDRFDPDRYALSDARMRDVTDAVFGFGRRACPGAGFADNTLFAVIATVLATCEILPAVDAQGVEQVPEVRPTSGAISFPEEFPIRVRCRSQKAMELLIASVESAEAAA